MRCDAQRVHGRGRLDAGGRERRIEPRGNVARRGERVQRRAGDVVGRRFFFSGWRGFFLGRQRSGFRR